MSRNIIQSTPRGGSYQTSDMRHHCSPSRWQGGGSTPAPPACPAPPAAAAHVAAVVYRHDAVRSSDGSKDSTDQDRTAYLISWLQGSGVGHQASSPRGQRIAAPRQTNTGPPQSSGRHFQEEGTIPYEKYSTVAHICILRIEGSALIESPWWRFLGELLMM